MARRPAPHRGLDHHYGDADDDDAGPSKTALKAEAHALQKLGRELSELPAERLAAVGMPEPLREAILAFQRTRSHEGRRRQLQYVGKLMRRADAQPLREAVAQSRLPTARQVLELHRAERWREELVHDDGALARWLAEHPQCDAQRLRALLRQARRDAALSAEQRHGRAWRELYRFIQPHVGEPGEDRDE